MEGGFEKDQDREGPETVDRQSLGGHRSSLDEYHDHINVKGAQISQEWSPRCGPLLSGMRIALSLTGSATIV